MAESKYLLPTFGSMEQVLQFYSSNKDNIDLSWKNYYPHCLHKMYKNPDTWRAIIGSKEDFELVSYSIRRFHNQLNEALNKLWATLELVHLGKGALQCKTFQIDFALGTIIPALHYSRVSTMVAYLSLFGIVSIPLSQGKNKELVFYNLTRTSEGWVMYKRTEYLARKLRKSYKGWHAQILAMYEAFREQGISLPDIDLENARRLQRKRNKYHYDILGDSSMQEVYKDRINIYFSFVDSSLESIRLGIIVLRNFSIKIGYLEKRFSETEKLLAKVKSEYVTEAIAQAKKDEDSNKWKELFKRFPKGVSQEEAEKAGLDFFDEIGLD